MRISDWSSDVCSSDLNATLQSKLRSCTEGDIEWTAFHQLLEYLAPLVRAEKAVMLARGYRGQDVQVVVPAARKAEIEAAVGKRELSLQRHAANGIPLQQPVTMGDGGGVAMEALVPLPIRTRSDEHTSELQSLMRIPYAVFCLN